MIFNTKGKKVNVPPKVKEFLDYIKTKKSTNSFTDRVEMAVKKARQNKEWRLEYMKTLLHDMDVRLEGEKLGDLTRLVSQVTKKIHKGKEPEVIAEELEEDIEYIKKIYDIAVREDMGCDIEKIIKELDKVQ